MRLTILVLIVCCLVLNVVAGNVTPNPCRAEVFVPDSLKQKPSTPSPDGQFRAILRDYREGRDSEEGALRLFHGERLLGRYVLHDLSAGIFVKWSPDSRAFYIMWSNGGMVGGYDVRVFRVSPNKAREVFPTKLAEREFRRGHDCRTRGINIFAIQWIDGSERLKIAAQVYPASDCGKEMGFTMGYTVRLNDGAVLERYPQEAIEKEMKECPALVWPTAMWDDNALQQAKAKIGQAASRP